MGTSASKKDHQISDICDGGNGKFTDSRGSVTRAVKGDGDKIDDAFCKAVNSSLGGNNIRNRTSVQDGISTIYNFNKKANSSFGDGGAGAGSFQETERSIAIDEICSDNGSNYIERNAVAKTLYEHEDLLLGKSSDENITNATAELMSHFITDKVLLENFTQCHGTMNYSDISKMSAGLQEKVFKKVKGKLKHKSLLTKKEISDCMKDVVKNIDIDN